MAEQTPMVRQYLALKEQYTDSILFFRLGDFYEMFYEDAEKSSALLGLTLTSRNKNSAEAMPMCGVPFHSAQSYINKLVAAGHKVAICEQVEDPATAKGLVKRDVVAVYTPGVTLDPEALTSGQSNYLVALYRAEDGWGLALADISTGFFKFTELLTPQLLENEVLRLEPSEIVMTAKDREALQSLKAGLTQTRFSVFDPVVFSETESIHLISKTFGVDLAGLSLDRHPMALMAIGLLLSYLIDTKSLSANLLLPPRPYHVTDAMVLDDQAKKNLELLKTLSDNKTYGSLIWHLDQTKTSMGSRLLRQWMLYPLLQRSQIEERHQAVAEILTDPLLLTTLRERLALVHDLERIQNRLLMNQANARDLLALAGSLKPLEEIKQQVHGFNTPLLKTLATQINPLTDLCLLLQNSLVENPPLTVREGGLIREGVSQELDEIRYLERDGKTFLAQMETRERERTGISSLKIRYNQVFGYYIEITHTHRDKVPSDYIRKQTLTNAERYITPELKEYEDKILNAQAKLTEIEYQFFLKLRERCLTVTNEIKQTANAIATLDVLLDFAYLAREYRYEKPVMTDDSVLEIKEGRHPLVEHLARDEPFVPNNLTLSTHDRYVMMITGPNMAGKSTVMRQTALIVLMAQMGSFVPATEARLGVTDQIFTRIGASDYLQKGQSTFMVEMIETARILAVATSRSLIILDEIGRGTSTFDGLSIAWAVAETIHDKIKARTLFATHYHELTDLAAEKSGILNVHMAVKEYAGKVIFLRELREGGTNRSYGIYVASMAGLPAETIKRAREILKLLEAKDLEFQSATQKNIKQPSLFDAPVVSHPLAPLQKMLQDCDPDQLSPKSALEFVYQLKSLLEVSS